MKKQEPNENIRSLTEDERSGAAGGNMGFSDYDSYYIVMDDERKRGNISENEFMASLKFYKYKQLSVQMAKKMEEHKQGDADQRAILAKELANLDRERKALAMEIKNLDQERGL
jgi:hypothetical protein